MDQKGIWGQGPKIWLKNTSVRAGCSSCQIQISSKCVVRLFGSLPVVPEHSLLAAGGHPSSGLLRGSIRPSTCQIRQDKDKDKDKDKVYIEKEEKAYQYF